MKIVRLDLIAFGPFTGVTLDFSGGSHGLHIVFGPNEAGKSSSLRALRQWLYGIPHLSPDNFLHANPNVRIGGVLERADGSRLEFIRRKGRSKTLRGPDDIAAFDETRLHEVLHGVDSDAFAQRFAIDYDELRRGGEAVVRGGGDVGDVLFAAGAGVADLDRVRGELDSELNALFKSGGSKPKLNRTLARLKEIEKEIRDAQLPTSEWQKHDRALREMRQRRAEILKQLAAKRSELDRLRRITKSFPLVGRLKQLERDHADVASAPLLPEDFTARRVACDSDLKVARRDVEQATKEIETLKSQLAKIELPRDLLEHTDAIEKLNLALGSHDKAARDRPGLVVRRDEARRRAEEILHRLGRPRQLDEAESLRLSQSQRKRIQQLSEEYRVVVERCEAAESHLRELTREIERLTEMRDQVSTSCDVAELERSVRFAQQQGDLDEQLQQLRRDLAKRRDQAAADLAKLPLFTGTIEELERLPVPSNETIERFGSEMADAEQEVSRWRERIAALSEQSKNLQTRLDKLELEHDVPSEQDLEEARRQRDEAWELLCQSWPNQEDRGDERPVGDDQRVTNVDEIAESFWSRVEQADAVVDRLRREADRVAEKAALTAGLNEATRELDESAESLSEAVRIQESISHDWAKQWQAARFDPLSPREMRAWRDQQQELAEAAAAIRRDEIDVEELERQIESLKADLNQCLDQLGESPCESDKPLTLVLERCRGVAERIREDQQQRRELERTLEDRRKQHDAATLAATESQRKLDEWRTAWSDALVVVGLDGDTEPSVVGSFIESVDELLKLVDGAEGLHERIRDIDSEAEQFLRTTRSLLEQVADDLTPILDESVERAVGRLTSRLRNAEKDQHAIDNWSQQLEAAKQQLHETGPRVNELEERLGDLCRQAGCQSPNELPQAEERASRRRRVETGLSQLRDQLVELASGAALDDWIHSVEQFDPGSTEVSCEELERQIEELEREAGEVAKAIGRHENELSRMDGGSRAADAQAEAESALAAIQADAEQYIRLRLASEMLARAMARYREENQGPVLGRASDLFAELTLGSFSGLRVDHDGKRDVLVGVRARNGREIGVEGMSDGTCDQLYLALRLATLEVAIGSREPLPFIVDDILVMFDDERAIAALNVLAKMAAKTQVIFFTHHEHLVQLAREHLPGEGLNTHQLVPD